MSRGVFGEIIGQQQVVETLRAVAAAARASGAGMTHAWLFVGPPGSGRSVAARAFAAALQCRAAEPGCGECTDCRTVLAGTHPDVTIVRPQGLSLGVAEARELVARAALAPANARWQVVVLEDADRLTEGAANVLLKAIEEPAPRTVWLLCVPAPHDLVPTIRSRCRLVTLRTPPVAAVAELLIRRNGVAADTAELAARAAGAHIGRALRLATDARARARRSAVLEAAARLAGPIDLGGCLRVAADLVDAATSEATTETEALDQAETAALREALGEGGTASGDRRRVASGVLRGSSAALRELEARQKSRASRAQRDALDRTLMDLAGFFRDVLLVQLGVAAETVSGVAEAVPGVAEGVSGAGAAGAVPGVAARSRPWVMNADVLDRIRDVAARSTPEMTLHRIDAIMECRAALAANANPLLAFEALAIQISGLAAGNVRQAAE
ncbi:DNA polymerase III, delta prime subunit [Acidothermus cellulolyticus 11B]|uniref:DNA polymerase III, delta prime subunit n=1 Tax=Acidothermus cellulolyticus (strain ATCC 43068 / DSM 8971 / 11B) TaxID=351607 RepID=A0LWD2_ACIC1|nr:DNA polymerase III subunit delta' [Acidothermus cellulolyticus]ABK53742.1 DNA polymerase III, delta prime subunit [Acidothermus cellulolyticus 11B]